MSAVAPFTSTLAPVISDYLALKEALGCRYANERRILKSLDVFLTAQPGESDLTIETFERWCSTLQHLSPTVRRNHMRITRNLCLYRRRKAPSCFVPDPGFFPAPHQQLQPHIFTDADVAKVIEATQTLQVTSTCPLRPAVFRLGIVLLYTAGLRRGELLRLTLEDVDRRARTLLIRASKFHKSRCLPLSTSAFEEVDRYLELRRTHRVPVSPQEPLLIWNVDGPARGYTGTGFYRVVRSLLRATEIRKPDGRLPRVHDFRHSMAVNALLSWYRSGADVQAKLPLLATYLGHVSIVSTQRYLHFVDDVAASASARFAQHCGRLITVSGRSRGDS